MGFLDLVRETIAISQILSASAWHLVHYLRWNSDRGEDAEYSVRTARSLQQRLGNPATSTTNEVVITVLTFAAYAVWDTSENLQEYVLTAIESDQRF